MVAFPFSFLIDKLTSTIDLAISSDLHCAFRLFVQACNMKWCEFFLSGSIELSFTHRNLGPQKSLT